MSKRKTIMTVIVVVVVLLAALACGAWILAGYLPTRNIATPTYTVVEVKPDYEVRQYDGYIVAETVQEGSHDHSLNTGFGELFQYIAGNNTRGAKVPMTAPVLHAGGTAGEKIPMTAPVTSRAADGQYVVAFVMPPGWKRADLPEPRSAKVTLRDVPPHKAAVVCFSGNATEDVLKAKTAALLASLKRDGRKAVSAPQEAFYNPPWTPPFMKQNEVMVEISE